MNPLISVIVPVYNSEKTLNRCIDSIVGQTFTNWELLLIDDGSKDKSSIICDKYKDIDSRIRVFHKPNGGVSSARNLGLDNACGKWVTFIDSDDWAFPTLLENYIIGLKNGIDLVCQSFETDSSLPGAPTDKRYFGFNYHGNIQDGVSLLEDNAILGYIWVKLFRREIIERNNLRFDERFGHREDGLFCRNFLVYANEMICVDKKGYFYYVPDWNRKYSTKNKNQLHLYRLLYLYEDEIFEHKKNKYTIRFVDELVSQVIMVYKNDIVGVSAFNSVKFLRNTLERNILYSHLFFLIKWIVFLDRTCVLSYLTFWLYCKLK